MWEILKSWRSKDDRDRRTESRSTSVGADGAVSPTTRMYSQTVNFKDLNISVEEQEDGDEGSGEMTPALSETTTVASPRAMKLRRLERNKLIIIMVGLPGRGKTFLCNKLVCYLNWLGHNTKLFNVGSYRRRQKDEGAVQDASFFDSHNHAGMEARRRALEAALDDLKAYLTADTGQVAIFDATNTTNERRQYLVNEFHGRYQYLFIESICTDEDVLEQNYRYKMKYSPDYRGMNEDEALRDFKARIRKYEEVYEPLEDRTRHYIKLINMYIPGKIVFFLMQVCKAGMAQERKIWLTRHGESLFNVEGKIGGNAGLSDLGKVYAQALPDVMMLRLPMSRLDEPIPVSVWTSTLRRTIETAEFLPFPKLRWKALDEIHAGSCDGLTYEKISERFPDEYEARRQDKLRYRYPAGESYLDVIQRLEPVIIELERERECVCVVAHQAVLRAVYGYFTAAPLQDIPTLEIPLHSLIEMKPRPDGTMEVAVFEVLNDPGTGAHPSLPPPTHPEHKQAMEHQMQVHTRRGSLSQDPAAATSATAATAAAASAAGAASTAHAFAASPSNTNSTFGSPNTNPPPRLDLTATGSRDLDERGPSALPSFAGHSMLALTPAAGLVTRAGGAAGGAPPAVASSSLIFPRLPSLRVMSPSRADSGVNIQQGVGSVGGGSSGVLHTLGSSAGSLTGGGLSGGLSAQHPRSIPLPHRANHSRSGSHAGGNLIHVGSLGDVLTNGVNSVAVAPTSAEDGPASVASSATCGAAAASLSAFATADAMELPAAGGSGGAGEDDGACVGVSRLSVASGPSNSQGL